MMFFVLFLCLCFMSYFGDLGINVILINKSIVGIVVSFIIQCYVLNGVNRQFMIQVNKILVIIIKLFIVLSVLWIFVGVIFDRYMGISVVELLMVNLSII